MYTCASVYLYICAKLQEVQDCKVNVIVLTNSDLNIDYKIIYYNNCDYCHVFVIIMQP